MIRRCIASPVCGVAAPITTAREEILAEAQAHLDAQPPAPVRSWSTLGPTLLHEERVPSLPRRRRVGLYVENVLMAPVTVQRGAPRRHVILSLGACRLYDEPTRIRNVCGPTLRCERLALGRARTRAAPRRAMHARARGEALVNAGFRVAGGRVGVGRASVLASRLACEVHRA
jgi:hypothetical protein